MAMIDYGAVVKKNGKIISNLNGDLFQNLSKLKYERQKEAPYNTIVDETKVIPYNYHSQKYDDEPISMAGNYFALVGDKKLLIGFYKDWFSIALNGKILVAGKDIPNMFDWFDQHLKPLKYDVKDKNNKVITTMTISKVQKDTNYWGGHMSVYLAKFIYKKDRYEVLFGYGIDTSLIYTFTDLNYYHHKHKNYFNKIGNKYVKYGNYDYRKGLKFIREWTWNGLTEKQKLVVPKKYRLN